MTATTPTTITGVSILSRQKKRGNDTFELALSPEGIEVRRPERPAQLMSWDRVTEWEIEERKGFVLLTLHGPGATTPLVVPGWTLDDLEILMREVTGGTSAPAPRAPADPVPAEGDDGLMSPAATPIAAAVASVAPAPAPAVDPTPAPEAAPTGMSEPPAAVVESPAVAAPAEQLEHATREAGWRRHPWRVVVTVVLLGVLATAVILVLLQSAGIIDWSFLGPVA